MVRIQNESTVKKNHLANIRVNAGTPTNAWSKIPASFVATFRSEGKRIVELDK
jgi:hypothetical protein